MCNGMEINKCVSLEHILTCISKALRDIVQLSEPFLRALTGLNFTSLRFDIGRQLSNRLDAESQEPRKVPSTGKLPVLQHIRF